MLMKQCGVVASEVLRVAAEKPLGALAQIAQRVFGGADRDRLIRADAGFEHCFEETVLVDLVFTREVDVAFAVDLSVSGEPPAKKINPFRPVVEREVFAERAHGVNHSRRTVQFARVMTDYL